MKSADLCQAGGFPTVWATPKRTLNTFRLPLYIRVYSNPRREQTYAKQLICSHSDAVWPHHEFPWCGISKVYLILSEYTETEELLPWSLKDQRSTFWIIILTYKCLRHAYRQTEYRDGQVTSAWFCAVFCATPNLCSLCAHPITAQPVKKIRCIYCTSLPGRYIYFSYF